MFLETYMDAGKPRRRVRKNLPTQKMVRRVVRELQARGVEDPSEVKRVLHEVRARELSPVRTVRVECPLCGSRVPKAELAAKLEELRMLNCDPIKLLEQALER